MDNLQLIQFLNEQQNLADFRAKAYTMDFMGQKLPERGIYKRLYGYFDEYMDSHVNPRWITMTGIRGTGKTTILCQLYAQIRSTDCYTLFLSLDHTSELLGVSLSEILSSYESILDMTYETLDKPLIVFLDETQYNPDWFISIKTLLDRSDKIFVFVSGSTSLISGHEFNKNMVHEKVYPINSPEYIKITKQKFQIPWLGESIRDAILYSKNSEDLYIALQHIAPEVNTYYKGSLQSDFYRYFCYGSLPHLLASGNESMVYEQIQRTIDRILIKDLPVSCFHPDTVALIPGILFDLAHMDHCNVKRMALKFWLSRSKMSDILDALEWAELLRRIYPYGLYANEVVSRKPSKYLFSTPIFRVSYARLMSDIISNDEAKHKITEDLLAMYLSQVFDTIGKWTLMYDSSHDGADFVLMIDEVAIILQIGSGSEWPKQVLQSLKKIPSKYGIIITDNQLDYDPESGIIRIPLRMFLLM